MVGIGIERDLGNLVGEFVDGHDLDAICWGLIYSHIYLLSICTSRLARGDNPIHGLITMALNYLIRRAEDERSMLHASILEIVLTSGHFVDWSR